MPLVVAGGGAAGFMAAITAAEAGVPQVQLWEATAEPLSKVRISGGGRCNVTHACWDPRELVSHYPRGSRPLRGPFSRLPLEMPSPGLPSAALSWWRRAMGACFRLATAPAA